MKNLSKEEQLFFKQHLKNNPFNKTDVLFFNSLNETLSDKEIINILKLADYKIELWFPISYEPGENYFVEKEQELFTKYSLKKLKEEVFPKTLFFLPIKKANLKEIQFLYNFTTFDVNNYFHSFNKDWLIWTNHPINPNTWKLIIVAIANYLKIYTEEERRMRLN